MKMYKMQNLNFLTLRNSIYYTLYFVIGRLCLLINNNVNCGVLLQCVLRSHEDGGISPGCYCGIQKSKENDSRDGGHQSRRGIGDLHGLHREMR